MCPRCRSLVVAEQPVTRQPVAQERVATQGGTQQVVVRPQVPPPPAPAPTPAPAAADPLEGVEGASSTPRAARGQVVLIRTCPLCRRRYSSDQVRCSGCGEGATSARVRRDALDAERRSGARSGASEAFGVVSVFVFGAIGLLESGRVPLKYVIYLGVLGLIAAAWLRVRLRKKPRARALGSTSSGAGQDGAAAAGRAVRPPDGARLR